MLFSTTTFIILFLPIVLFIYYILLQRTKKLKNVFLLIVSIVFYAWGEPYFVFVMMLSIVINWIFGLLIDKYREKKATSKVILSIMLIFNLGILGIFKYLTFIMININSIFKINMEIPNIVLPIGISFFTFQAISYVIDVYKQDAKVQKNLLNMGLYISFFPQLIAGPIVRYKTIAEQIQCRKENFGKFSRRDNTIYKGIS